MSTEVDPERAAEALDRPDRPFLLDVRRESDFAEWHVEGAHNVPVFEELLDGNPEALDAHLAEIPDDRPILTVCAAGVTAARAAAYLRERGYDAKSIEGGMRGWATVYRPYDAGADGITQVVRPATGCLSYLVADAGEALVVDPGRHADTYAELLAARDLEPVGVVDTHAHADHLSGGPALADRFGVPYYLHERDAGGREHTAIGEGDELAVGGRTLEVVATPGHTRGSVTLLADEAALTGDTLFVRSVGRPDLEGGPEVAREGARLLFDSLARLRDLPDDTLLLPGHFSGEPDRPVAATLADVVADNELAAIDDRDAFVEAVLADLPETPANHEEIKAINRGERDPGGDAATLELGPNNCASN